MTAPARPVTIGRIGAPQGVRGWFRVQSFARPPESILDFRHWWVDAGNGWQRRSIRDSRVQPKGQLAVALDGCDDRDAAAALRHATIAVDRDELPEPERGEWYWVDLIGLAVETTDGIRLGRVDRLLETGANDVLVVRGERERLIPWVPGRFVTAVEPGAGRIVVDWDPEF